MLKSFFRSSLLAGMGLMCCASVFANEGNPSPLMGWSSWNTYRVNISDSLIKCQADALVKTGLKDCGYRFINIDDGYFGGRDASSGQLLIHPVRFPEGLKPVVDHIHSLGLKAGIYSDAGRNTCGNFYDNDTIAVAVGLYGHDEQDADFFFKQCGFDFIKIDFCGGIGTKNHEGLDLNEKERYTAIRRAIESTGRTDVRMNICRWDFPGTWADSVADSWRISHDIAPRWSNVKDIIDQNLYLSAYARNGRYNDMDMLEVGRGLSTEEDKTHFGLWCMMSSPLLIGCDLNSIKPETLALLKNRELISLNQDPLALQAYVAENQNGVYLLVKDIERANSTVRAIAVYNSTDSARTVAVDFATVNLGGKVAVRDLFGQADCGTYDGLMNVDVPPHATRIYRLDAEKRLHRTRYEAETAYLSRYQEIYNNRTFGSAVYAPQNGSSGEMVVEYLGLTPDNDLQWRDVNVARSGMYDCKLALAGDVSLPFIVNINGEDIHAVCNESDCSFKAPLNKGNNIIRVYTVESDLIPPIDYIDILPVNN